MITMVGKGGKVVELPGVNAMPSRINGVVIVESATHPELKRLAEKYNLNYGNLSDALDINEAPRLEHRDDYDYLYLRLADTYGRHDAVQITHPMLAAYNSHVLILISSAKLLPVLDNDHNLGNDLADATTIAAALITILARSVNSFDYFIKSQTDAIHNVVARMQAHHLESEDFINFIMIEDQINSFISALTPLIPLFNRLQTDRTLNLSVTVNDMLTDVILTTQQSINLCDANAKRIVSIRDAYTTLSNNSLNRVMKTLTIATLLIAAPNLVFSMYGMNIRLPMQHADIGFAIVLTLAILITILFIVWGKKRHLF